MEADDRLLSSVRIHDHQPVIKNVLVLDCIIHRELFQSIDQFHYILLMLSFMQYYSIYYFAGVIESHIKEPEQDVHADTAE